MISRFFFSLLLLLINVSISAESLKLNPDHPNTYIVAPGDTLWDISGWFLQDPWKWPELWNRNTKIENPHLIYPNDVLSLVLHNGKPVLNIVRSDLATYKMSPKTHEIMLEQAIPTIPFSEIEAFLTHSKVLNDHELNLAPYVLANSEDRIISGAGDTVYVRGIEDEYSTHYNIFKQGKTYTDPHSQEILGYEALYKGSAYIIKHGDPATLKLQTTSHEILSGDRLLPVSNNTFERNFIPHAPDDEIKGEIISLFNGVSQVGQYQIVVINRGERDDLEVGHVLSISHRGKTMYDNIEIEKGRTVILPDEVSGIAMVFKTFEKVSYIIIMNATKAIHLYDKVHAVN